MKISLLDQYGNLLELNFDIILWCLKVLGIKKKVILSSTLNCNLTKTEKKELTENVNCTDLDFYSAEQQADSILAYMEKAKDSSSANRIMWEQKFFCSFPSSFKGMQAVFGYDNENGAAPLYDYPKGENIIGYIEGTDLKDELLIITAHYDHLGTNEDSLIYNGADDNGSGTSSIMEIAQAFMLAKKEGNGPRRSILIMPVSGEEKGLLGSKYYVDNPIYPLENTIVNLNIDMIGRIDDYYDNPDYVYLIGSDRLSTELHQISEDINKQYINLKLDYKFNEEDDPNRYYYRSDHYNFAKKNIPVIFYFNGIHADYHKTSDTVDKIHFGKIQKISRYIFLTAWELANRNERPKLD